MPRHLHLSALIAAITLVCAACAAENRTAGYMVRMEDSNSSIDATSFCMRGAQRLDATDGLPLKVGDFLTSGAEDSLAVIFVDGNAVRLAESSSLRIVSYDYPEKKAPTDVKVESGSAYFSVNPRPEGAHFFVSTPLGKMEVMPKTATAGGSDSGTVQFSVSVSNVNNVVHGTVAVLSGTVSVSPIGGGESFQVSESKMANIAGDAQQVVTQSTLNVDQLKDLAAGLLKKIDLNQKDNAVTIKYAVNNSDNTTTVTELKESKDAVTKSTTTIANDNSVVFSNVVTTKENVLTSQAFTPPALTTTTGPSSSVNGNVLPQAISP
jgi:hypothetical protein